MMCGKYQKLYRPGDKTPAGIPRNWGSWGEWPTYKYCPPGQAICGLQTKVQHWKKDVGYDSIGTLDNTALNRVKFYCCYLLNHTLDICLELKVEHIDHWKNGESGMYFYFSGNDLTKKIGASWGETGGTKFEVIQEGSNSWTGQVVVFKHSSGAHGRRVIGYSSGQWKAGDTIKFKNC